MNIEKLREELKIDEGVKYEVYLDHLGLPTCGIGHLITEDDDEHGKSVGTAVSEERVNELFELDIEATIGECNILYENFYLYQNHHNMVIHLDLFFVPFLKLNYNFYILCLVRCS